MKNTYLNKVKNILREVWMDFKDLSSYNSSTDGCCGFDPTTDDLQLHQEPIRINRAHNNLKNIK